MTSAGCNYSLSARQEPSRVEQSKCSKCPTSFFLCCLNASIFLWVLKSFTHFKTRFCRPEMLFRMKNWIDPFEFASDLNSSALKCISWRSTKTSGNTQKDLAARIIEQTWKSSTRNRNIPNQPEKKTKKTFFF